MSGASGGGEEKSHEATPRRLERARLEGDLPRSQDAQTFAAYLGFAAVMLTAGAWAATHLGETLVPFLDRPTDLARQFASPGAGDLSMILLVRIATVIFPLAAAPAAVIAALLIVERGVVFVPSKIQPKLSRISPLQNARSKYGTRGLVEFGKSVGKLTALSAVLGFAVSGEAERLAQYAWVDARLSGQVLAHQFRLIMTGVLLVAGLLALFDVIWQRLDHLRRMRMSHQEVKEEGKQTEGDPHVRAQRRDRARQIANNRMLLAVPEADVVIVNPVHYAVALKWRRESGAAPICLAKGIDEIALAIRARAEAASVPVHVDPPTARSIHGLVDLGHEVRPEHYQAVAAAIIFAEEMRRKAARAGS